MYAKHEHKVMEDHQLQPRCSGDFATSRRGSAQEDIEFIAARAARDVPLSAIAKMVGRSVASVKAAHEAYLAARRTPQKDGPPAPPPIEPPRRAKNVRPRPMPERVAEIAARRAAAHGCTLADLMGSRGSDAAQLARQAAYHAVRSLVREDGRPRFSYALIGAFFGGRDHTTVLHGVKVHQARMDVEAATARRRAA